MRRRDAVHIEVRAAKIAASMLHDLSHNMLVEELVGWMRCGDNRECGSYPKSLAWQAGWLAATIFSHENKDRRDQLCACSTVVRNACQEKLHE